MIRAASNASVCVCVCVCACVCVSPCVHMWVYDLFHLSRYWVVNIKGSTGDLEALSQKCKLRDVNECDIFSQYWIILCMA